MNAPVSFNYTENLSHIQYGHRATKIQTLSLLQLCHLIPQHLHILFCLASFNAQRPFPSWTLTSPPSFSSFMFDMTSYSLCHVLANWWLVMTRKAVSNISVIYVPYNRSIKFAQSCCTEPSSSHGYFQPSLCILRLTGPLIPFGISRSILSISSAALSLIGAH